MTIEIFREYNEERGLTDQTECKRDRGKQGITCLKNSRKSISEQNLGEISIKQIIKNKKLWRAMIIYFLKWQDTQNSAFVIRSSI